MTRFIVLDFAEPRIFITTKNPEYRYLRGDICNSNCQWMQLNAKLEKDIQEVSRWLRKRKKK